MKKQNAWALDGRVVLGLDIDDIQTRAAAMRRTEHGWQKEEVVLTGDGQGSLPVCICYEPNGKSRVGWETIKDPDAIFGFRRSPFDWTGLIGGVGRCWGAVLWNYVSLVWEQIMKHNPVLAQAAENRELLVLVSFPDGWDHRDGGHRYRQMLRQATGYDKLELYPWMASVYRYLQEKKSFELEEGLMIWRFGYHLDYAWLGRHWERYRDQYRKWRMDCGPRLDRTGPEIEPAWNESYERSLTWAKGPKQGLVYLVGAFGDTQEIAEIAARTHPGREIWQEKPPYTSAAEGLCLAGIRMIEARAHRNQSSAEAWDKLIPSDWEDDEWEEWYEQN